MKSGTSLQFFSLQKITFILVMLLIQSSIILVLASPALFLNISTDKQIYEEGDTVKITGNVTLDGSLVTDAMVALQVDSPDDTPYVLRTAQTGTISETNWEINITELYPCDNHGNQQETFLLGSTAYYKIKWRNYSNYPRYIRIAIYIEYSNKAPFYAYFPLSKVMSPQKEENLMTSIEIPKNAPLGTTTIYANVYTEAPKNDGYPYCPEKNTTFTIASTLGSSAMSTNPTTTSNSANFNAEFSLAMAKPGTYDLYATVKYQGSQVSNLLSFGVQPKDLPPIAYFAYYPSPVGVNMTITFDGSGSIAQGYNDVIIRYEWRFGDGTPPVIVNGTYENPPDPKVTHIFVNNGTYIVTLNVTDNESLWNTTSKEVTVVTVIPPTADFTWSPQLPYINQVITFDAGISKLGWNGTAHPPIISCQWDFGDGYIKTVTSLTIEHQYSENRSYTVTLTITDAGGQQDHESKTINVQPPPPQGNADVDGNGQVDMTDIIIVVGAFGSKPGDPNWDERADIDKNGRVDMTDIMIVVDNFGKKV